MTPSDSAGKSRFSGPGYMDDFGQIHPTFCLSCHDTTPQALFNKEQHVLANALDYKVIAYEQALAVVAAYFGGELAEGMAEGRATVSLYRAVGVREYNTVMESQMFKAGANSLEGRQFAFTEEEALEYAKTDLSKVAILRAEVSSDVLPELDFSKNIDPFIFKNGVITVQPGKQSQLFHDVLQVIEHVY